MLTVKIQAVETEEDCEEKQNRLKAAQSERELHHRKVELVREEMHKDKDCINI